jgi:hypothetical protein
MKDGAIFISNLDNTKREVDWVELIQLKKDILWIYDENIGRLNAGFIPHYSFSLKYWEYLTLDSDKLLYEEDRVFYKTGVLVILLCQCVEYNCIPSGNQQVFNRSDLPTIFKYVEDYKPKNGSESRIREKILFGLTIAKSMTEEQLIDNGFEHQDLPEFYDKINAIGDDFMFSYYRSKLKKK